MEYVGRWDLLCLVKQAQLISEHDMDTYGPKINLPIWFKDYMRFFRETLVKKSWQLDDIEPD